jgi:hypothetical protein
MRLRRTHRLAGTPDPWLGDRGKQFTYDALHKSLRMRADRAGIAGSIRTGCDTPPPIAGSPPVAPRAG